MIRQIKKLVPQKAKNYYHLLVAVLAVLWFGHPSRNLKVIGVTGTDGKTTTATLIYHILKFAGKKVALITSVAAYIGDKEFDTGFHVTTPDPFELQKHLRTIRDAKMEYVVLEATSHAFDQHRLFGIRFDVGVVTNVTDEHLDYHATYHAYLASKAKLLKSVRFAVLNKSDQSYKFLVKKVKKYSRIASYTKSSAQKPILAAIQNRFSQDYNQENATAATIVALESGISETLVAQALKTFSGVPGRMEEYKNTKGIKIFIDFAHTSNAIKKVLRTLKKEKGPDSKLIVVFGCASERDVSKRPVMAKHATRLANISVFTAEDPRYEDIKIILTQMVSGVSKTAVELSVSQVEKTKFKNSKKYYLQVPDRGEAITVAIDKIAQKGDVVAICGKGHEKSMSYFGVEYPWSEHDAVKLALEGKTKRIEFRK